MRAYSWNMYCYNKNLDGVFDFVKGLGDVVCLQEVPHKFLPRLSELELHMASVVDSERVIGNVELTNYNVILSHYPLSDIKTIPFADIHHPLRTRIVIWLMWPMGWAKVTNRNAVSAIAQTPSGSVQIVCAHLTLSTPLNRAREFGEILKLRDTSMPAIIAGDLNIIELPRLKFLSWLFGGTVAEALPSYPERRLFDTVLQKNKLQNPLARTTTHTFSRSQLDHILVSDTLMVKSASVEYKKYGSDHHPISVEVE